MFPPKMPVTCARAALLLGLDETVAFLCWLLTGLGEAGGTFGQMGLEEVGGLLCWLLMGLGKGHGFLCWVLMGLGDADGLLWAGPEEYGGFWRMVVSVVEWNEAARRQTGTTKPVICATWEF